MVTVASVKAWGPELASFSDPLIQTYIDIVVDCMLGEEFWGDCFDNAASLLAAHFVTLAGRGGTSGGPITSEKVGDLARSYGQIQMNGDIDELSSTSYGMIFITLRKTRVRTPMCV